MVGLAARLEKVSPDIDFYAGDGGEQGQPEKDLIYARLFHNGSFEIRLNWNNSQNWETATLLLSSILQIGMKYELVQIMPLCMISS